MRVSKVDYIRLKAKTEAKKARNAIKRADTNSLMDAATGNWPLLGASSMDGSGAPESATGLPGPLKRKNAKTARIPSQKVQIKAIKNRILCSGGFWSLAVRARDGHRCVMCGKTETLQAHHWLFRRAHSMALAVEIDNGITLCYGCHIGRVHRDGDGDFILQLADRMTQIIGPNRVVEMRAIANNPKPLDLEWWKGRLEQIKIFVEKNSL